MRSAAVRPRFVGGPTSERIVAAARSGDVAAFGELVTATYPQVYALARRLVGDEHDARDVVQDTYLRAFRKIHTFRADSAVETWLYRIAANCASSHLRRSSRRRTESLDPEHPAKEPAAEARLDAVASAADDRERLALALQALPYELRSVVVLHDVYDLAHGAIAAELRISIAASKVRLHRARRRLRDLLYEQEEGGVEVISAPGEVTELARWRQGERSTRRKRRVG